MQCLITPELHNPHSKQLFKQLLTNLQSIDVKVTYNHKNLWQKPRIADTLITNLFTKTIEICGIVLVNILRMYGFVKIVDTTKSNNYYYH